MFRLMTVTAALGLLSLIGLSDAHGFGPRGTNVAIANNGSGSSAVSVSTRGGFFNRGTNVSVATSGPVGGNMAIAGRASAFAGVDRGGFQRDIAFSHGYGRVSFNRGFVGDPFIGYGRGIGYGVGRGFYGASYGLGASYGMSYGAGASYNGYVDQGLAQTYFDPAPQVQQRVIEETIQPPPVVRRTIVTEQVQQMQSVGAVSSQNYGATYSAPLRYALPGCGCRH